MKKNYSFYFQKNNSLFNSPVISACYKANDDEIKKYGLTNENILIIFKHDKFEKLQEIKSLDYYNEIKNAFENETIFLRIQSECLLGMYGDTHCDCEEQRIETIKLISKNNGIYIHLPQEAQGWGLHYKLNELELQVSGRNDKGKFIGIQNRDDAQKILLGKQKFEDCRNYEILINILKEFKLNNNKLVILSNSEKKIKAFKDYGLNAISMEEYKNYHISEDNLSEYLIKILNETHSFDETIMEKLFTLIENRKYNSRSLSTIVKIIEKIKNDKDFNLKNNYKKKFLETYDEIICGVEKKYVFDEKRIKIQNNFSCKVNSSIFNAIYKMYGPNIFDRMSLEKLYYFESSVDKSTLRIRSSQVLDTVYNKSIFLTGQVHVEQRIFSEDKSQIIQNEISLSKLRSYFENSDFNYVKRVEMITIISENQLPGINIYIKKLPNIDCRIMDVYGPKEKIKEFLNNILNNSKRMVLNDAVSNQEYEDENFTNYNLRFANIESAISEEKCIYNLLKKGE